MTKTLPKFPDFRLFTIDDISWYRDFYFNNNLNPYADLSPENLFIWINFNDDLQVSKLEGAIVFRYSNIFDGNQINIVPLANPLSDSIINKVMVYLEKNNLPLEIQEIPSIMCDKLDNNKWLIEDDKDSFEYILDIDQHSSLEGSSLSHQRNRIASFEREHSNDVIEVKYYKEFTNAVKKAFLHHINTVPPNSNKESAQKNVAEPVAFKRGLKYASIFHKKALVIKINGKVVSLSMVSYLDKNTAGGNFLKVDYSIRNIFRYTVYQIAKALKQDGIKEINIEQDLGVDGIRSFKKHLSPLRFLGKKIIRRRPL